MSGGPGADHGDRAGQRIARRSWSGWRCTERANDDLTHTIFTELARNFITPLDREDIHQLASALDDVADFILAAGKNLELFGIGKPDDTAA
jgi:uncharacterized protein Yka (UPF0111/DUF47 family)